MSQETEVIELEAPEVEGQEIYKGAVVEGEKQEEKKVELDKPVKPSYSSFRDVFDDFDVKDEDFEDEDKFKGVLSRVKEENKKLKTVAAGREIIEKDPDIKEWTGFLKKQPDELITMAFAHKFISAGKSEKEALDMAKERLETLKTDKAKYEDTDLEIRTNLRNAVNNKQNELFNDFENAQKSVDLRSFDDKVLTQAQEAVLNTESFLGLTPAKSKKTDLLNGAKEFISKGNLQKALKDPATLAKVAMFLKYEKQWEATIASRNEGKAKIIQKLQSTPTPLKKKGLAPSSTSSTQQKGAGKVNVASFLGKKN